MVHNGIEYGDIQLICEAYHLLKTLLGLSNDELKATFEEWNKGDLDSYLIEISAEIFGKKEEDGKSFVVDNILDVAGQKGTGILFSLSSFSLLPSQFCLTVLKGKWTAINALDLAVPVTLIGEAVFARCLSALKVSIYSFHFLPLLLLFASFLQHFSLAKQYFTGRACCCQQGPPRSIST